MDLSLSFLPADRFNVLILYGLAAFVLCRMSSVKRRILLSPPAIAKT